MTCISPSSTTRELTASSGRDPTSSTMYRLRQDHKESKAGKAGHFPLLDCTNARKNYVFIFFSEGAGERGRYWVIPSMTIVKPGFGNFLKSGKNKGKYRLILNRPKYAAYVDAFEAAFGEPSH